MMVRSTRGGNEVPLSQAILQGLAPDGGLFMPPQIPKQTGPWGHGLVAQAEQILAPYCAGDTLATHLHTMLHEAFTFHAPTAWLTPTTGLLELFHGPTAAFKDFGARFLAAAMHRLIPVGSMNTILVATSGDTGAAVASAFQSLPGFRVIILYPSGRVSPRQAHQLGAFGDTVRACEVQGTFDDCQRLVKEAFADPVLRASHRLTSANSISLGRLLPQITYFAHAAMESVASGHGVPSFVVPTGNLGNALACMLAREAGFPIDRVVCATNANRAIADLAFTGRYAPAHTIATLANAMDVGAPSNVERLLHRISNDGTPLEADWVDDASIRKVITQTFADFGRAICPHTACGVEVLRRLRQTGTTGTWIVAATAHPAKFQSIVEPLIGTSIPMPPSLATLLAQPTISEPLEPALHALARILA